ncbi:hypothetical protein E8E13_007737 [Curvularia kusanoi]|uniref:Zn(2)-C6 fungal-type domain-containing protein n=1 Tax=Curvularia kusanoi TaxID=90978 RepID=A0A9P4TD33_CURKU|nr:hypothetical protein E8E13_007737 [Curvularia kusanoi]
MSSHNYDGPRRFSRSNSARTFPEVFYDRNTPGDYHRSEPYAYSVGGPVHGLRNRPHTTHEEYSAEQGGARRRIAVACARCRKRKIRCSGPTGDGEACHNCKAAGVEAEHCQFHRVGSDHAEKVIDNLNMANSLVSMASAHNLLPIYTTGGHGPYYRTAQSQSYAQVDTKLTCPQLDARSGYIPNWLAPCEENTSPVENYCFDQPSSYLRAPAVSGGSDMFNPSYRCTQPTLRTGTATATYYSDYGQPCTPNGLTYLQSDLQPAAPNGLVSSLDMSSLQFSLPERPRQRQQQPTEVPPTPRRRLPAPQPKPGYGLHHALDQQQDQRLRSSQTGAASAFCSFTPMYAGTEAHVKPQLPWAASSGDLTSTVNKVSTAAMPPPSTLQRPTTAARKSPTFFSSGTINDDLPVTTEGVVQSSALSFSTMPLLDPLATTAPTPPAYSNFRESRESQAATPTSQITRNDSATSLYTFNDGSSGSLVSGRRYTPLSHLVDSSSMDNLTGSFQAQSQPMRRASESDFSTSF